MNTEGNLVVIKVALHGVPRSGTTWVGEILNSSPYTVYCFQPLFSYVLKSYLTPTSSVEEIDAFFARLLTIEDEFICQRSKRASGILPRFGKLEPTHVIYKEVRYINILPNLMERAKDVLLIGLIRNPLSVVNSWLRAPKEFRADLGWDALEEWRCAPKKNLGRPEEFNGFEKWKEAAHLFHDLARQYPCRVRILRYSDVISAPLAVTKSLFEAISLSFTSDVERFLEDSCSITNPDPYSVYRQQQRDDKWKQELDPGIVASIVKDLKDTELWSYIST